MSESRRLQHVICAVGEGVSGATLGVLSSETGGVVFRGFGIDDGESYLETADGDRFYLDDVPEVLAKIATEQNVVAICTLRDDMNFEKDPEYFVEVYHEASNNIGGP